MTCFDWGSSLDDETWLDVIKNLGLFWNEARRRSSCNEIRNQRTPFNFRRWLMATTNWRSKSAVGFSITCIVVHSRSRQLSLTLEKLLGDTYEEPIWSARYGRRQANGKRRTCSSCQCEFHYRANVFFNETFSNWRFSKKKQYYQRSATSIDDAHSLSSPLHWRQSLCGLCRLQSLSWTFLELKHVDLSGGSLFPFPFFVKAEYLSAVLIYRLQCIGLWKTIRRSYLWVRLFQRSP